MTTPTSHPYPLGREVEHDEASRGYAVEPPRQLPPLRSVEWRRWSPILDQSNLLAQNIRVSQILRGAADLDSLGSCTGNALTGWSACEPFCTSRTAAAGLDEVFAIKLYALATRRDRVRGSFPPSDTGSTGNGVCKAGREIGRLTGWGWCFTTDALLHTLQRQPVICGVPWYTGMFEPDLYGHVHPTGDLAGGHEFLIRGYDHEQARLLCDNSWSDRWNPVMSGSFWLSLEAWEFLRKQQADVTVPQR